MTEEEILIDIRCDPGKVARALREASEALDWFPLSLDIGSMWGSLREMDVALSEIGLCERPLSGGRPLTAWGTFARKAIEIASDYESSMHRLQRMARA